MTKRSLRRGSEALQAHSATAQTLQRPEAGSWSPPPASLCDLRAGGKGTSGSAIFRPAAADQLQPGTPAQGGHLTAFLPHPDCAYQGQVELGNISANGHPGGGPWRQLYCSRYQGYFLEEYRK